MKFKAALVLLDKPDKPVAANSNKKASEAVLIKIAIALRLFSGTDLNPPYTNT